MDIKSYLPKGKNDIVQNQVNLRNDSHVAFGKERKLAPSERLATGYPISRKREAANFCFGFYSVCLHVWSGL